MYVYLYITGNKPFIDSSRDTMRPKDLALQGFVNCLDMHGCLKHTSM